jgi:hypothetical protein
VNTLRISKNKLDQPFKITKGEEWEFIIVEPLQLAVRFDIDPHKDSSRDDKFILSSTDGSINIVKTIVNDTVPDDNYTDILYEDLDESKNYTLKVDTGEDSYLVFENVPASELFHIGKKSTSNNNDDFEDWDHEGLEDHDHEFENIDV